MYAAYPLTATGGRGAGRTLARSPVFHTCGQFSDNNIYLSCVLQIEHATLFRDMGRPFYEMLGIQVVSLDNRGEPSGTSKTSEKAQHRSILNVKCNIFQSTIVVSFNFNFRMIFNQFRLRNDSVSDPNTRK